MRSCSRVFITYSRNARRLAVCVFIICLGCHEPHESVQASHDRGGMDVELIADRAVDQGSPIEDSVGFQPAPPRLKRITNTQYRNTIDDVFGLQLPHDLNLSPDNQLHGFRSIAASMFSLSLADVEAYESTAYWVARAFFSDEAVSAQFIECDLSESPCIEAFINQVGALLWRRPIRDDERSAVISLWLNLSEQPFTSTERAEFVLSSLLQAPDFLFFVEHGEPDPSVPTQMRKTSRELLTAMSLLLWDAPPSETVLSLYANRMYEPGIEDEVYAYLINDPRSARGLVGFFEEYLQLDRLDTLEKSRSHFVLMSDTLASAMKTEATGMIKNVVLSEEADIRSLLTTKETYLNEELAQLYNEPAPDGFTPHRYGEHSPRAGFLTTAAFLALNAHNTVTSPTYRGKYVQNRFFCFDIPPPPEGIDTTLDPPEPGVATTMRQRVARHNSDPVCNGCHQFMDPIGLAFENFDAIGIWRTDELGEPIDPSGTLDDHSFRNHHELIEYLASDVTFAQCVTRQFIRFAWSRLESRHDEIIIEQLNTVFERSGFNFLQLVRAVIASPTFKALAEVTIE